MKKKEEIEKYENTNSMGGNRSVNVLSFTEIKCSIEYLYKWDKDKRDMRTLHNCCFTFRLKQVSVKFKPLRVGK